MVFFVCVILLEDFILRTNDANKNPPHKNRRSIGIEVMKTCPLIIGAGTAAQKTTPNRARSDEDVSSKNWDRYGCTQDDAQSG